MNFPSAEIQAPQVFNPQYDSLGQRAGQMFTDLTTAIAKMPQDLRAYEQLQAKMKNLKQVKEELAVGILSEFGQDWSEGEKKRFVSSLRAASDPEEILAKSQVLFASRQYQKEKKIPLAPVWGQRDYLTFIKPWEEKVLTEEQIPLIGEAKTRGEGEANIAKGTFEAPTPASRSVLQGLEQAMTPYQKAQIDAKNRSTKLREFSDRAQQAKLDFQEARLAATAKGHVLGSIAKLEGYNKFFEGLKKTSSEEDAADIQEKISDNDDKIAQYKYEVQVFDEAMKMKSPAIQKAAEFVEGKKTSDTTKRLIQAIEGNKGVPFQGGAPDTIQSIQVLKGNRKQGAF